MCEEYPMLGIAEYADAKYEDFRLNEQNIIYIDATHLVFRTEEPPSPLSEQIAAMEAEIEELKQSPAEWRPRAAPTR